PPGRTCINKPSRIDHMLDITCKRHERQVGHCKSVNPGECLRIRQPVNAWCRKVSVRMSIVVFVHIACNAALEPGLSRGVWWAGNQSGYMASRPQIVNTACVPCQ